MKINIIGAGLGGAIPLLIGPMVIYSVVGTNSQGNPIKAADSDGMMKFGVIMGVLSVLFYFFYLYTQKNALHLQAKVY